MIGQKVVFSPLWTRLTMLFAGNKKCLVLRKQMSRILNGSFEINSVLIRTLGSLFHTRKLPALIRVESKSLQIIHAHKSASVGRDHAYLYLYLERRNSLCGDRVDLRRGLASFWFCELTKQYHLEISIKGFRGNLELNTWHTLFLETEKKETFFARDACGITASDGPFWTLTCKMLDVPRNISTGACTPVDQEVWTHN